MPKIGGRKSSYLGLDTETTGVDLRHGAAPYIVTTCTELGRQLYFEWDVDPYSRSPIVPDEDKREITELIDEADHLVLQNPKFDVAALAAIGIPLHRRWPWEKTYDTLLAGHLLASNHAHDLTTMVLEYLSVDIDKYDKALKKVCEEARRLATKQFPEWRLAKKGLPEMPSAKDSVWKYDAWLPRCLAQKLGYTEDHPFWWTTIKYANVDAESTVHLFLEMKRLLEERKLWRIYTERLKVLPVVYGMERAEVTLSGERLKQLEDQFSLDSRIAEQCCESVAKKYRFAIKLPKSGNNKSLTTFIFDKMKLPVIKKTPSGGPCLDKNVLEAYETQLPEGSDQLLFIQKLREKRKRDTALSYMESYRKFWLPHSRGGYALHPSLNPTGTDTLRWSSSNPNEQNISKQKGFNIRYCFGPAPEREWWSCDAKNIELRLPAYAAGETEMINLFEDEEAPPYFGSYHMLIFDTLHPEKFAEHGMKSKDVFASSWYQYTKNGNFAVQYGAVEESGTADRAYHIKGAQRRIQERFSKIAAYNQKQIAFAEEYGYVETMPDKTVDPDRGYPLLCTRSNWGKVLPTVPLNYHIQGTAMWWMMKAMIRCQSYLDSLNEEFDQPEYFMVMQVHDELVFDFPKGSGSEPWKTNLPKMRRIKRLMAEGGNDIGIPTPVSCTYHANNWSEGIGV